MKLSAFISTAIFIAAVPTLSVSQYLEALNRYTLGEVLLVASRNAVNHGEPAYGRTDYGYHFDLFGNAGANFLENQYNGIDPYNIDASGIGVTRNWNRARMRTVHGARGNYFVMPNDAMAWYLDSIDMPATGQGRRSLRRKRSPEDGEASYDGRDRRGRRPQRRRRKNWKTLYDPQRSAPAQAGTPLVQLGGCPKKSGPINLTLKVDRKK